MPPPNGRFAEIVAPLALIVVVGGFVIALMQAYHRIDAADAAAQASWSNVVALYQRRAELVSGLLRTVRPTLRVDRELLVEVEEAWRTIDQLDVDILSLNEPHGFTAFLHAQKRLDRALTRFLDASGGSTTIRSSRTFRDLRAQLDSAEGHIADARERYLANAREYNSLIRRFPNNMLTDYYQYTALPKFPRDEEAAAVLPSAP